MTAPKLTPERLNALRIEANYEDVTGAEMHELLDAYEALQAERDRLAKRGSDADEEVQRLLHVLDERTNERDRYRATLEAADDLTKTLYPPLEAICCGAKDPVGVAQGALTMLDDEFRKEIGR
jgi:chromosome segregation ATPase